jgi:hypothetical protein
VARLTHDSTREDSAEALEESAGNSNVKVEGGRELDEKRSTFFSEAIGLGGLQKPMNAWTRSTESPVVRNDPSASQRKFAIWQLGRLS